MQGKIYGIGVGPGDPELMTLKAVRLIREADVIAIPGKEKETCTAYQIALGAVPEIDEKEIIPVVFPMTKNETVLKESHETAVKSLSALMDQGKTIAFLILGDVTVYSTYGYVHKKLLDLGYESVLVNGVPSFCAAAAKLGISLGEKAESIHILPGSYPVKDGLKLAFGRAFHVIYIPFLGRTYLVGTYVLAVRAPFEPTGIVIAGRPVVAQRPFVAAVPVADVHIVVLDISLPFPVG